MDCRLCGSIADLSFNSRILNKYDINYYQCRNCDLIQTEYPYWLEEAYSSAINIYDTGVMQRNLHNLRIVSPFLYYFFNDQSVFLDYAGGYGIFVRLMRDLGFNYHWTDLYAVNLLARGFEHVEGQKYDALTCFEFFEHAINPLLEIKKMLTLSSTVIFSTLLRPSTTPSPDWWYYGQEHGQHVSFYSTKTLNYIADHFNLKLLSNGKDFHAFIDISSNYLDMTRYFCRDKISYYMKIHSLHSYPFLNFKDRLKHIIGKIKNRGYFLPGIKGLTWQDHEILLRKSKVDN